MRFTEPQDQSEAGDQRQPCLIQLWRRQWGDITQRTVDQVEAILKSLNRKGRGAGEMIYYFVYIPEGARM